MRFNRSPPFTTTTPIYGPSHLLGFVQFRMSCYCTSQHRTTWQTNSIVESRLSHGISNSTNRCSIPQENTYSQPAARFAKRCCSFDMPLESCPIRFLLFSQTFEDGFLAYRLTEFREYFHANYVALPLSLCDAAFFNRAVFDAAGAHLVRTMGCMNSIAVWMRSGMS
jgi:hypothetical protein